MKLERIDFERADMQVEAKREIYVELPQEDMEEGMCAKLVKAMCGTGDAAQDWAHTYRKARADWGFQVGQASPCVM